MRSSPIQVGTGFYRTVSLGNNSTMAIDPYGTLSAWGENLYGQAGTNNITNNSWIQLSNGDAHSLALRSDNTLWAWGLNTSGQLGVSDVITRQSPTQVSGSWASVSAGSSHTLGIKSDNTLWAWGTNGSGSVGDGTIIPRSSPVQIDTSAWTSISAGLNFSLAIKTTDKSLWTWGLNTSYQLASNTTVARSVPAQVGIISWTLISAGAVHTLATDINNKLYGWGTQTSGQLGLGDTALRSQPTQIGASSWVAISAGYSHSIALRSDNQLFTWGNNTNGQLGFNRSFMAIAAGAAATSIIRSDGTLWTWGDNTSGQLGDSTVVAKSSPVAVGLLTTWSKITKPSATNYAIDTTSKLYAWGENSFGAIGDNTTINRSSPVQIGTSSWTMVATAFAGTTGQQTTYAIRSDGGLFAWGDNSYGQANSVNSLSLSSPTQIGSSSWSIVSAGLQFAMAITTDGKLYGWGRNNAGQLGVTASTFSWTKVNSSGLHTLALRSDNRLFAWGLNSSGQLGLGDTVPRSSPVQVSSGSYTQISAGLSNSYAVRSDGSLWAWGDNANGQLGDETIATTTARSSPIQLGSTSWSLISASKTQNYALATRSDNTLYGWGLNTSYQLGNSTTITRSSPVQVSGGGSWTAVSVGGGHALAVKTDYKLYAWGLNNIGQTANNGTSISWSKITATKGSSLNGVFSIRNDGSLWVWGSNQSGQLGLGDTITRSSPVQLGTSSWVSVVAGFGNQTFAIRNDGALFAWGLNNAGQLGDLSAISRSSPVQIGTSSWTVVSAGFSHGAAITTDGKLYTWGGNTYGALGDFTPTTVAGFRSSPVQVGTSSWTSISVGEFHALAIRTDGTLWVWGYNAQGQLGINSAVGAHRSQPVQLSTSSWSQVDAMANGSIGITSGKLFTWGANGTGVLGQNDVIFRSSPVQVGSSSWSLVFSSQRNQVVVHGITISGTLWAWGFNGSGNLGDSSVLNRSAPVQIGALTNWTGGGGGFAINNTGQLWGWGYNVDWQLGQGDTAYRSSPVQVGTSTELLLTAPAIIGNSSWTTVSAGGSHSTAIRTDGGLFTWGLNTNGQLGLSDTVTRSSPVQVGTSSWTSVNAGGSHTLASRYGDNQLFTWGFNTQGQLGSGVTAARSSPVQVNAYSATTTTALTFNGSSQYLNGPTNTPILTTGQFTIEAWINLTTFSNNPVIFGNQGWNTGQNIGFIFYISSTGNIIMAASAGVFNTFPSIYTGTNIVSTGSWTHVAITRDGSNVIRSFINGTVDPTTATVTQSLYLSTGTTSLINVGGRIQDGAFQPVGFTGQMSNFRIVPNKAVYTTTFTPPTTALSATQSAGTNIAAITGIPSNGYSVWFNGSNMSLSIASTASLAFGTSNFTVECWVYLNAVGINQEIFDLRTPDTANLGFDIYLTTVNLLRFGTTSATYISGATSLVSGTWYHVAVSRTGTTTYQMFLNGVQEGSTYTTSQNFTNNTLRIGNGANGFFNGFISNLRVITGQGLYSGTFTPSTSPLTTTAVGSTGAGAAASISGTVVLLTCRATTIVDNSTTPLTITNNNTSLVILAYSPFGTQAPILVAQGAAVTSDNSINAYTFTNVATVTQSSVTPFIQLLTGASSSAGASASAALGSDGSLNTWGLGTNGQLGDNTIVSKSNAVRVGSLTSTIEYSPIQVGSSSWSQVSAGASHSVGIKLDSTVFSWGKNDQGQLGDGTVITRSSPVQVGTASSTLSNANAYSNYFNSSSYFTVPYNAIFDIPASTQWTLECWVYTNATTTQVLAARNWNYGGTGPTWGFALSNGVTPYWGFAGTGSATYVLAQSTISGTLGQWNHYAFTRDFNNDVRIFVNGQVGVTRNDSSAMTSGSGNVYIGVASNLAAASYMNGYISNLRIVKGQALYTAAFTPTTSPLSTTSQSATASNVALLTCQNTTIIDNSIANSGSGFVITNTGVTYSLATPFSNTITSGAIFATQISTGSTHSVVIDTSSKLYAWGLNSSGQLALNDTANRSAPVQIGLSTNWNTISAGADHTMALDNTGTLYAWGLGTSGQLGDITAVTNSSPVLVTAISIPNTSSPIQVGTSSYSLVSARNNFSTAISTANKLFVWGLGTAGRLGIASTTSRSSPMQINSASYNLVSAGGTHTTFVPNISPQLIIATGLNTSGQLGDNSGVNRSSPVQVGASTTSFNSPVTVSTGNYSSYYVSSPTQVGTSSWTAVSAGGTHTLAIRSNNTLWAWGYNANGQLGGSNTINRSSPVQVGTSSWSQVSAGDSHNIILKSDGTINTFGLNSFGQLGDGT